MADRRHRVAVIGGGIAGLAAARRLALDGNEVMLLEAEGTTGGKLRSATVGGVVVDVGPDAFVSRRPEGIALCQELGIADELVAPGCSGAAVWARGRLRALPDGLALGVPTRLLPLARSGIVGPAGVLRAAVDYLSDLPWLEAAEDLEAPDLHDQAAPPAADRPIADGSVADGSVADRSVAELVAPRLGNRVTRRLVDPLVGGIHAGPVTAMSAAAVFPALLRAGGQPGSLMRALRQGAVGAPGRRPGDPVPDRGASNRGSIPTSSVFATLRGGMAQMAQHLEEHLADLGVTIVRGTRVDSLLPQSTSDDAAWELRCGSRSMSVDGVVLALPAPPAANVLDPGSAGHRGTPPAASSTAHLARTLRAIDYATVAVVTLAFSPDGPARRWRQTTGTGFLIPAEQGLLTTGVTWLSSKWPHLSPSGPVLVRMSTGRYGDTRCAGLDDTALVRRLLGELRAVAGDVDEPIGATVTRWNDAFPQYRVGHLRWAALAKAQASALPPLALAGAAYDGVGIPACIGSGEQAAQTLRIAMDRPNP